MSRFLPPPTRYGSVPPSASSSHPAVQRKVHPAGVGQRHAPPPTRFGVPAPTHAGGKATLQPKRAPCPGCVAPPPQILSVPLTIQPVSKTRPVKKNLTFKEITGGNIQTTTLRASLNGEFLGKFNNVTRSMADDDTGVAAGVLNWMQKNGYGIGDKDKPHAEDYMIYWMSNNKNLWQQHKTDTGMNLLSMAMDKTPCIVCARNLVTFKNKFGLTLRIKAGFHFELTRARGRPAKPYGVDYLEEQKVPIRSWPLERLSVKLKGKAKPTKTMRKRFKISAGAFALDKMVKAITRDGKLDDVIGWKTVGYSRSQSSDKEKGRGWK